MSDATFQEIPLARLHESPLNPRKTFAKAPLEELAASIKAKGIIDPLIVRPNAKGFEIAAGHRRYRAAKLAGLEAAPAIVREMTDVEFLEILTIENLQREDVHPLEEADGYRQLIEKAGYDADAIAAKVGKSASYVYQRLKLADLLKPAREAFLKDYLTAGHAILIARLQPKDQAAAMKRCFDDGYGYRQRDDERTACSVRQLAHWIDEEIHLDLHSAPWKKDDATLVPAAGACTTCPKRTGANAALFPDIAKKDTCTDGECFQGKKAAFLERQRAELEAEIKQERGKGQKVVEISTLQRYELRDEALKGLDRDSWHEAKKTCKAPAVGLIVSGKGVGGRASICVDKGCRTLGESGNYQRRNDSYAKQERRQAQKAKDDNAGSRAILNAIRAKVTGEPLPRKALELVAKGFWDDVWSEVQTDLVRLFGWTDDKEARRSRLEILDEKLPELTTKELHEVLVALAVAKELHRGAYDKSAPKQLLAMAKLYKVDPTKARKAPAAKKAPVQTSAKGKAKK